MKSKMVYVYAFVGLVAASMLGLFIYDQINPPTVDTTRAAILSTQKEYLAVHQFLEKRGVVVHVGVGPEKAVVRFGPDGVPDFFAFSDVEAGKIVISVAHRTDVEDAYLFEAGHHVYYALYRDLEMSIRSKRYCELSHVFAAEFLRSSGKFGLDGTASMDDLPTLDVAKYDHTCRNFIDTP